MKILPLIAILSLVFSARASPATAPATQPANVTVVFIKSGGIAGIQEITVIATDKTDADNVAKKKVRISPEQASRIARLVKDSHFMDWKTHDSGPGTWNDSFHYELDITIDNQSHAVHVPADDKTEREVERLLKLFEQIRKVAGLKDATE